MCDPGAISWIEDVFGDCIVTTQDKFSFAIGMLSNVIFLVSSIPQIMLNLRRKKVDGQSPLFFPLLFTASALNFIGVIITHGLVTQLCAGLFYVLTDGTLLVQFIVYKYITKTNDGPTESEDSPEGGIRLPSTLIAGAMMMTQASATDYQAPYTGNNLTGTIFGWAGGLIFTACRIPQLVKNMVDKQVADFSISYVILNILGNMTYAISVLMRRIDSDYLWKQAPFIVGSTGPMTCDMIFMLQRCLYPKHLAPVSEDEPEESEASRVAEL
jgi:uncharacterized protein with PQ loop repeat